MVAKKHPVIKYFKQASAWCFSVIITPLFLECSLIVSEVGATVKLLRQKSITDHTWRLVDAVIVSKYIGVLLV